MKLGTAYCEHVRQQPDYFVIEVHEDSNWLQRGAFADLGGAYQKAGELRINGNTQPIRILQRTTRDRLVSVYDVESRPAIATFEEWWGSLTCYSDGTRTLNGSIIGIQSAREIYNSIVKEPSIGLVEGGSK